MRYHLSARAELLDHLEAARLLHQHALGLVIYMARLHDETVRHPPDELAFTGREREKLVASGIAAFADEFDHVSVRALQWHLVEVSPKKLVQPRFAAASSLLVVVFQRSSLSLRINQPANRYTIEPGRAAEHARSSTALYAFLLDSSADGSPSLCHPGTGSGETRYTREDGVTERECLACRPPRGPVRRSVRIA